MHNFSQDKEHAIEQLREMNRRATQPSAADSRQIKNSQPGTNIPSDALLILGLILILSNENCDKLLLLALLYIMG